MRPNQLILNVTVVGVFIGFGGGFFFSSDSVLLTGFLILTTVEVAGCYCWVNYF